MKLTVETCRKLEEYKRAEELTKVQQEQDKNEEFYRGLQSLVEDYINGGFKELVAYADRFQKLILVNVELHKDKILMTFHQYRTSYPKNVRPNDSLEQFNKYDITGDIKYWKVRYPLVYLKDYKLLENTEDLRKSSYTIVTNIERVAE